MLLSVQSGCLISLDRYVGAFPCLWSGVLIASDVAGSFMALLQLCLWPLHVPNDG